MVWLDLKMWKEFLSCLDCICFYGNVIIKAREIDLYFKQVFPLVPISVNKKKKKTKTEFRTSQFSLFLSLAFIR